TTTTRSAVNVKMSQQSPGVYVGVAQNLMQGAYEVGIEQRDADTGDLVARSNEGFVVPYPSEFAIVDDRQQVATSFLSALAQLGGGKVLALGDTGSVWTHDIPAQPMSVALWPWL